jgi:predicted regulator of Ras-like GTPase activity (Roadblock/LC7/MglB family)
MFGFLKKILKRGQNAPNGDTAAISQQVASPSTSQQAVPGASSTLAGNGHHARNGHEHNGGHGVEVSLQSVLDELPLELQPRVVTKKVGPIVISVPLDRVLAQLSQGVVKISFGELRSFAPHVFSPEADQDKFLVPLPLSEILPRLNPALIKRRRVQRHVEVPPDISSPFDVHGRGLALSVAPLKAPEVTPASAAAPAIPTFPGVPNESISAPPLPSGARWNQPAVAAPAPPKTPMPAIRTAPPAVTAATPPQAPAPTIQNLRKNAEAGVPSAPAIPMLKIAGNGAQAQKPAANPRPESVPLVVALTTLAEAWPESVRKEVVQLNLVDAKVALPAEAVDRGLRQGRLAFPWRTLRSWIKPAPLPSVSAQDGTVLELPLKVVAPIFLNRQRENAKTKPKVAIDEDIPNLFFGFPQPETAAEGDGPATAKPSDTNYYVWDDASDSVRDAEQQEKQAPSVGTRFISKYATPNEIVSRAASLDGVSGALISLPDGLLVASRISTDLNADTLAAFLPQIFGKVSQCTKELRMGELNNLNFTVGNVPWKIFRVNAIFFAAFGRAGEPLPTAKLAALAAELDHKPK